MTGILGFGLRAARLAGLLLAIGVAVAGAAASLAQGRVQVEAPASVEVGSRFAVSFGQPLGPSDFVTIVEAQAAPGTIGQYFLTGHNRAGFLVAPGTPGLYEVRYVQAEGRQLAGVAVVEVLDASVSVDAPATAMAGAPVLVKWSEVVSPDDIVTIVPAGAPADAIGDGIRVRASQSATLTAPTTLGPHEVRYLLDAARRPLGSAAIEVVEPEVKLFAPQTAALGENVLVSWDKVINPEDLITIVPADSPPETISTGVRVSGRQSATMVLPREPGAYEVRYVLAGTRRPVGRAPIEIGGIAVNLTAPNEAVAGQAIPITWSHAVTPTDVVTIVGASEPADRIGPYFQVRAQRLGSLQAPPEPGDYEVRYLPSTKREAVARVRVKVAAPAVVLSGDETAEPGGQLRIGWDTVVGPNDVVTLVPAGVPEQQIGATILASTNKSATLTAPLAPGDYEIRYILSSGGRVLARRQVTVAAPPAETQTSASGRSAEVSLMAPDRARAGEMLTVEWEGPSELLDRLTIAVPDSPATTWIASVKVGGDGRVEVPAPETAGDYEIRYLNLDSREIIARAPLRVEQRLTD